MAFTFLFASIISKKNDQKPQAQKPDPKPEAKQVQKPDPTVKPPKYVRVMESYDPSAKHIQKILNDNAK